jgi:hypothetical protein
MPACHMTQTSNPDSLTLARNVAWTERPYLPVSHSAALAGCSSAQIYALAKAGRLSMVKVAGRTLVTVESLRALLDAAVPYVPDGTNPRGRARVRAAEAAQRAA